MASGGDLYEEGQDTENQVLLGMVLVYVDDFVVVGSKDSIVWFETELRKRWEETEFGSVDRDWYGNFQASQRAYIKELVKRHGLEKEFQSLPIVGYEKPEEEADRMQQM